MLYTYEQLAKAMEPFCSKRLLADEDLDAVPELTRRGLLQVSADYRVEMTDAGREVCDKLAGGERAPELD